MTDIIIITSLLILLPIVYWISKRITAKKTKRKILSELTKGTGRMGIIRFSGTSYGFFEVEELVVAGNRTKVILHDVIIDRNDSIQDKEKVLKKYGGNEWVNTETIIWYDNNSQTMRNNKLEKILN